LRSYAHIERKERILESPWLQGKAGDLRATSREFLLLSRLGGEALAELQGIIPLDSRGWVRNLAGGAETLVSADSEAACGALLRHSGVQGALSAAAEQWGVARNDLTLGRPLPVRYEPGAALKLFHWDLDANQYGNVLIGVRCGGGVVGGATFFGNGRFKLQLEEGEVACWRNYDGEDRLLKDTCHGVGVVTAGVRVVLTTRINRKGFRRPENVEGEVDVLLGKRKR
jgi:hypothetical protein